MTKISASIEASPKQIAELDDLPGMFPPGCRVYMTDIGTDPLDTLTAAARRLHDLGYTPVPHFAARRIASHVALEARLKRFSEEAGVHDVLIVGGGVTLPAGEFASAMDILETGLFDKYGIAHIAVAGHPEGSPDFSEAVAIEALKVKRAFAERTGAEMRIVTQFGFDAQKFIDWAEGLAAYGIDTPVHLGVAGPARITTLVKYAAMCGIGNSIAYLRKNALSLAALATSHSPEGVVEPIERYVAAHPHGPIRQIHVFPFGGVKKSAEWLIERGSWTTDMQDIAARTALK